MNVVRDNVSKRVNMAECQVNEHLPVVREKIDQLHSTAFGIPMETPVHAPVHTEVVTHVPSHEKCHHLYGDKSHQTHTVTHTMTSPQTVNVTQTRPMSSYQMPTTQGTSMAPFPQTPKMPTEVPRATGLTSQSVV